MGKEELLIKRLAKHPHLIARFEALLDLAENSSGEFNRADDAEEQLIKEVNKLGCELLYSWAVNLEQKEIQKVKDRNQDLINHSKKNSAGKRPLAK